MQFATAARSATQFDEEWLAPTEFRKVVKSVFKTGELQGEDEDRLVLLADKNTSGAVRWRPFIQGLSPTEDLDPPESPMRKAGAPSPPATVIEDTMNQTWRRPKAEQNGGTAVPPQPPLRATVPGQVKPNQVAPAPP